MTTIFTSLCWVW